MKAFELLRRDRWKSPDHRRVLWLAIALIFLVTLVYANAFENAFHFDDFHTITDNPAVRQMSNLPRFFSDPTLFSVLPPNQTYRPVVSASLTLDYALGHGYVPFWFHLSTFLLFLLLIASLWILFDSVFSASDPAGRWPSRRNAVLALLGAAWFGVHPAMAETVNYIIQRGDLYCTLGCVLALVLWVQWPAGRKYGLYLLPFVFALLSKPPAAVFPVLLFTYAYLFEYTCEKGRWAKSLQSILPAVGVTIAGLVLQSAMTPKSFTPSILDPAAYRLGQPYVWLRYFGTLFLPLHLNVDSDLAPFERFDGRALVGLLFALGVVAVITWASRRRSAGPIAFGTVWFLVTQLPTSAYPLSEMENDHRMFFSFPGLILAVLWAAWLVLQHSVSLGALRRLRPVLLGVALLALSGYAWGTHLRNRVWKTEESLWLDDVEKSPKNGRGLMIYGLTQMNRGAYAQALEYLTRAQRYAPNYPTLETNLGIVTGFLGQKTVAEQHFRRAIGLAPQDDQVHAFYGRWLLGEERFGEALTEARQSIALNPRRALAHDVLMMALSRTGDATGLQQAATDALAAIPEEPTARSFLAQAPPSPAASAVNLSLEQYRRGQYTQSIASAQRALSLDPKMAVAYNNIGAAYGAMGRWDDAVASELQALALDANLQIAKNNLALFRDRKRTGAPAPPSSLADLINRSMALNQAGEYKESIDAAQQALKIDPASAIAWNNIAANYEAMHEWDQAIAAARRALELQPGYQLAKNNLAWAESQKKSGVH